MLFLCSCPCVLVLCVLVGFDSIQVAIYSSFPNPNPNPNPSQPSQPSHPSHPSIPSLHPIHPSQFIHSCSKSNVFCFVCLFVCFFLHCSPSFHQIASNRINAKQSNNSSFKILIPQSLMHNLSFNLCCTKTQFQTRRSLPSSRKRLHNMDKQHQWIVQIHHVGMVEVWLVEPLPDYCNLHESIEYGIWRHHTHREPILWVGLDWWMRENWFSQQIKHKLSNDRDVALSSVFMLRRYHEFSNKVSLAIVLQIGANVRIQHHQLQLHIIGLEWFPRARSTIEFNDINAEFLTAWSNTKTKNPNTIHQSLVW